MKEYYNLKKKMGQLCGNPNFEMLNGRILIFGFEKEKRK